MLPRRECLLANLRLVPKINETRDQTRFLLVGRRGLEEDVLESNRRWLRCSTHCEVAPLRADLEEPKTPVLLQICSVVLLVVEGTETLSALSALEQRRWERSSSPLRQYYRKDTSKRRSASIVRHSTPVGAPQTSTYLLHPLSVVHNGHIHGESIFKSYHPLLVAERKRVDIRSCHDATEWLAQATAEIIELGAAKLRIPALGLPVTKGRL